MAPRPRDAAVHLGYAVGTGTPVEIPVRHMCVTGMTQESGKTTALEALIARGQLRAVAFLTKRGEGSFQVRGGVGDVRYAMLSPFFRERADWQYISSLIDITMGDKNKILHSFLMKVCRGAYTLQDVLANVRAARDKTRRGFDEGIYTQIEGYLGLVVPQLDRLPPEASMRPTIHQTLNVVDLTEYSAELQALCIRSMLDHVNEHERGVVVVLPEAWEFIPEGKGSPVKAAAERLIRKGAGIGNYLWIDSQDLGGVWKTAVRACAVTLIGVQREANEIKRTLANIPSPKPKADDVALLELGEFFACWGRSVKKTYVQPIWLNDGQAAQVAVGRRDVLVKVQQERNDMVDTTEVLSQNARLVVENDRLRKEMQNLRAQLEGQQERNGKPAQPAEPYRGPDRRAVSLPELASRVGRSAGKAEPGPTVPVLMGPMSPSLLAQVAAQVKEELRKDPVMLRVALQKPEIAVSVTRPLVEADGVSALGRCALLVRKGFFDNVTAGNAAFTELRRFGFVGAAARIYEACDKLVVMGILSKEESGYRLIAGEKSRITEKSA